MAGHIQIKLFASLQCHTPPEADQFPISSGQTVEDLLTTLGVSLSEVKLVFVNGIKGEMNAILKDGDRVGVFPPVGGG
jgi:molybdopterin converting factor small subunit